MWINGICGFVFFLRNILRKIVDHPIFENIIILSVISNTVILSLDGLIFDKGILLILENINLSFTILFTIEMGAKLIAYGFINYSRDTMNLFDGCIVIISLVKINAIFYFHITLHYINLEFYNIFS